MNREIKLFTRRDFITKGIGIVAATATIPTFLSRTAWVMGSENSISPGKRSDPILVVIQLSGGNDGLNTVIPYAYDQYYHARPSLAIPRDKALKINDEIALHPNLVGFKDLYDSGKLAIVQGVGYPNPDRSHFRSMEIWQSAVSEGFETKGWVGRMFDHTCANEHLKEKCSPTLAVSIGET